MRITTILTVMGMLAALVPPFVHDVQTTDSTGPLGLSGWTSPNTPVGPLGGGQRAARRLTIAP